MAKIVKRPLWEEVQEVFANSTTTILNVPDRLLHIMNTLKAMLTDEEFQKIIVLPINKVLKNQRLTFADSNTEKLELEELKGATGGPKAQAQAQGGGGRDDPGNFIMSKLYDQYKEKRKANPIVATVEFKKALMDEDLYPNEVLKLMPKDKYIFVMTAIVIRVIALYLTEWAIYNSYANTFMSAFFIFILIYTMTVVVLVLVTNSGDLGFRVIFNYLNIDSPGMWLRLFTHIGMVWMVFLVTFTILAVQGESFRRPGYALSDSEKINMISNLESITNLVWFIVIIVSFMAQ